MHAGSVMSTELFQTLIDDGRAAWDALLHRIPAESWETPGAAGFWSPRDLLAHIAWGEEEIVQLLRSHDFTLGSGLWLLSIDTRNRLLYSQRRTWPLDFVIGYEAEVYANLRFLIVTLDEADLNDPARFEGMPRAWRPWQFIASNTFGHYDDHAPAVEEWLRNLPSSSNHFPQIQE